MDAKDFGKIVLIVNECANLGGTIFISNKTSQLGIKYPASQTFQTLRPCDLSEILTDKKNEYSEQVRKYKVSRIHSPRIPADGEPCQAEKNAVGHIGNLKEAKRLLGVLTAFQNEQAKEGE